MKLRFLAVFLFLALFTAGVSAHVPGAPPAPDFELEPITMYDGGEELVSVTVDDLAEYHGLCTGKGASKCVCVVWAFRAAQTGINEIWGDEVPQRADIALTSSAPSVGATQSLQYITGTGKKAPAKTEGVLNIILPDGTEVSDLSMKNLKKVSKDNTAENYHLKVERISTGESVELPIAEGVFADDYFDLRLKSKYTKDITDEESAKFVQEFTETRDMLLTAPSYDVFDGIEEPPEEEPDVVGGGIFFVLTICLLGGIVVFTRKK